MSDELKAGSRLRSAVCDTEVTVVRAPKRAVVLACGGHPMLHAGDPGPAAASLDVTHAAGTALGKRYEHPDSGLEVLCTKGGSGSLSADGVPLHQKGAKPLPSSD
jgi:hypothetical protein